MEILPNEILHIILEYATVDTLETCSKVCTFWKKISKDIIQKRLENIGNVIPSETLQEIRTLTLNPIYNLDENEPENLSVLKTYERNFLESSFEITRIREHLNISACDIPNIWLTKISELRACTCQGPGDDRACLILSLRFMPCHALIAVIMKGTLGFFNEEDPQNSLTNSKSFIPYTNNPSQFFTSPDAHSCISIYHDCFVAQETPRCFTYCKISVVDHKERIITIERLRRVFTPFWSHHLLLFKEKVIILYTTGYLGVWTAHPDLIVNSEKTIALAGIIAPLPLRSLTRLNNLIMVKLTNEKGQKDVTVWTMLDGNTDSTCMVTIPMIELINSIHPDSGSCCRVFRTDVWNNMLIVHYAVKVSNPKKKRELKFNAFRMKRDPTLNDFTSVENFKNLFHLIKPEGGFRFGGITTGPFPVLLKSKDKCNKVVNILGITQFSCNLTIYNIGIFCTSPSENTVPEPSNTDTEEKHNM